MVCEALAASEGGAPVDAPWGVMKEGSVAVAVPTTCRGADCVSPGVGGEEVARVAVAVDVGTMTVAIASAVGVLPD